MSFHMRTTLRLWGSHAWYSGSPTWLTSWLLLLALMVFRLCMQKKNNRTTALNFPPITKTPLKNVRAGVNCIRAKGRIGNKTERASAERWLLMHRQINERTEWRTDRTKNTLSITVSVGSSFRRSVVYGVRYNCIYGLACYSTLRKLRLFPDYNHEW